MTDGFDWRRSFSRLRFAHPEIALREIAAHLLDASNNDGRVDPSMLILLAQMIDPDERRPIVNAKLDLRRLAKKAPPTEPNYELRLFLEHQIDVVGGPVESVVAEAMETFGVSRSRCFRELAVMRRYRKSVADLEGVFAKLRK